MALLIVSIVAVALAAFFGALAWRLTQQDQLRSAARVAALSDAIDGATATAPPADIAVQSEFLAHERPRSGLRGLLGIFATGAAVIGVISIIALAMMGTARHPRATAAANALRTGSLELLSMRHQRDGDTLTVTGLVRNGGSAAAERLTAVVFTFDRSGNFVASGRAPLDFVSLAPGDESPFHVSVPNVGDVGRYRVSFRNDTGVVRHVDKRQALLADRGPVTRDVATPR